MRCIAPEKHRLTWPGACLVPRAYCASGGTACAPEQLLVTCPALFVTCPPSSLQIPVELLSVLVEALVPDGKLDAADGAGAVSTVGGLRSAGHSACAGRHVTTRLGAAA